MTKQAGTIRLHGTNRARYYQIGQVVITLAKGKLSDNSWEKIFN